MKGCWKNTITVSVLLFGMSISLSAFALDFASDIFEQGTDVAHTPTQTTTMQANPLKDNHAVNLAMVAKNFGLTKKEYQQYLFDIRYTPDRYFYDVKQTYPLWVLAAHETKNPALFSHYVRASVKIAYLETERMEAVNVAFSKTAHQLYPNQYPVMTAQMQASLLQAGDKLRLFCKLGSTTCENMLPILTKRMQSVPDTELDLFLVGQHVSSQAIEAFAKQNDISHALVSSGRITLNFGNRAFALEEAAAGQSSLPLPYLTVVRFGRQIPLHLQNS